MAGLLGGIAGLAEATTKIAGREIERRETDIRDDALLRKQKSLTELSSRLTAGREEAGRAATSEEKRKEREFKLPEREARIGLLEAQTEKTKRQKPPKAPSVAELKYSASQALERIGATFEHSGVDLIPDEAGTIKGAATAEQLRPLIKEATAEGFDLITSKGELLNAGTWDAIVGRKAEQMINFTVVPSEGGLRKRQPGPPVDAGRLKSYVESGRTEPAKGQATTQPNPIIEQLGPTEEAPARKLFRGAEKAIKEGLTMDPETARSIRERRAARERRR